MSTGIVQGNGGRGEQGPACVRVPTAGRPPALSPALSLSDSAVGLGGRGGRAGSSVPTPRPTGSSGAQGSSGGSSSAHYAVNSQFTMGGPAISMASPMSIPTNTMHYGS